MLTLGSGSYGFCGWDAIAWVFFVDLTTNRSRRRQDEDGQQYDRCDVRERNFVVANGHIEVHPERRDHHDRDRKH